MLADLQNKILPYLEYFGDHAFIQAGVIIVASFFVAWIFNSFIITFLKRMALKTKHTFDDYLVEALHTPLYYSLLLLGFSSATLVLELGDAAESILFSSIQTLVLIIWVGFLLKTTKVLLKRVARDKKRVHFLHPQTLPLFENLANISIIVLAVYFIFSAWHVDMTAWLASAGIVGIAVGFAAKDTLANLFSGVFILADAPYKIGDYVVLDTGERGAITHIGMRSTRLMTRDDVEVTVPNSMMGNTKIINESGGGTERSRIRIKVGVAYGSDIDKVRDILMKIAKEHEETCDDPEPRVRFRLFGASSLDFELLCWIHQPVDRGRVLDAINCKIYKAFQKEGVEIPYSKHDLYIKEMPKKVG